MLTVESTRVNLSNRSIPNALDIPYVTADEAFTLLTAEFERFNRLLDTLEPGDWGKPTACTAWNVQDMLAHQAGGYLSGLGYREMIRQYTARPKPGQLPEDAINDLQVGERRGRSPAGLILELRSVGPIAIHKWAYQFRLAKAATNLIPVPHPVAGKMTLQYLMWVIHSRDTWMHRLDICRATGRPFEQTAEHDGRIAALVMRDVALQLAPKLEDAAILFDLTGVAGGLWKVGAGRPDSTVRMDALDFNIFVSGRFTHQQAQGRLELSGDVSLAQTALKDLLILY